MNTVANPRSRLAPRTSAWPCALGSQNSFSTTSSTIPKTPAASSRCHRLTDFHHQLRKINPQNHSTKYQMLFNIHNSNQDHRGPGACGFLLTS
jgi:hypothetical protein